MEWVSFLYRLCTISICFNHTHISSRVVVPTYTFGIKPPILSMMITFLFKYSISPLFLRLHHISFKRNVHFFCRTQGPEICRGCTLGFRKNIFFWPMSGRRDLHVDLGSSLIITVTLYSIMIFPAMDSGSFMLRIRKACQSFGPEDPESIAAANPSHNNISFYYIYILLSKYSTKKNISELRSNW